MAELCSECVASFEEQSSALKAQYEEASNVETGNDSPVSADSTDPGLVASGCVGPAL